MDTDTPTSPWPPPLRTRGPKPGAAGETRAPGALPSSSLGVGGGVQALPPWAPLFSSVMWAQQQYLSRGIVVGITPFIHAAGM